MTASALTAIIEGLAPVVCEHINTAKQLALEVHTLRASLRPRLVTCEMETLTPGERAVVVDTLAAVMEAELVALCWSYEQRWHDAHLGPAAVEWLSEGLGRAVVDLRVELLAAVRDVVSPRVP